MRMTNDKKECAAILEKLTVTGHADPEIENHCRNCPECAAFREIWNSAPPVVEKTPPSEIDDIILAAAAHKARQMKPFKVIRPLWLHRMWTACAALVIAVGIITIVREMGNEESPPAAEEMLQYVSQYDWSEFQHEGAMISAETELAYYACGW